MTRRLTFVLTAAVSAAIPSVAEMRASKNYGLPADTLDGGGGTSSQGAVVNTASLAGLGGNASSSAYQTRSQHPARLVVPVSLDVTATPDTVAESGGSQMAGRLDMDDGTVSVPAHSDLQWSPLSGPIVSISPAGLATLDEVYQDETAEVWGEGAGLSDSAKITVLNVDNDNLGSYAGDGIDDAWQVLYFGIGNPDAGPGVDVDGDGQSNFFEYVAGLIPTNSNSFFSLSIERVPGQPGQVDVLFEPRFTNRTYEILATPDLANPSALSPLTGTPPVADVGLQRIVTDTNAVQPDKVYGVEISLP